MKKGDSLRVPTGKAKREKLREKGQFWTPDWIADVMVDYVLQDSYNSILFDPAVGAGAFFRAGKRIAKEKNLSVSFQGMEIDRCALDQAITNGLSARDIYDVIVDDFVLSPPNEEFTSIVANPPYLRHHRIDASVKGQLKALTHEIIGKALDGRAGLHVYFLVRALTLLAQGGRLAFIMPADTCEGKFATLLWKWITVNYALDAVITFDPSASPFPAVDTNPIVFLIRNAEPMPTLTWVRCHRPDSNILRDWLKSGLSPTENDGLTALVRPLDEGIRTGLSRPPASQEQSLYYLGDFAKVVRGVATGSNEFFLLTQEQVRELGIPTRYFVRAVGRTRDVPTSEITETTLDILNDKARPTFLLALNGHSTFDDYPDTLRNYLLDGERAGLPQKPLISQRRPWYKTESRIPPPFLFAYLGRRDSRFIKNTAGVIPLTGFLCVYPRYSDKSSLNQLWNILNHPDVIANLALVGKSYGDGALKVEPRALEKLPIPTAVVEKFSSTMQLRLFENQQSCIEN